jgi:hypothetical protein
MGSLSKAIFTDHNWIPNVGLGLTIAINSFENGMDKAIAVNAELRIKVLLE